MFISNNSVFAAKQVPDRLELYKSKNSITVYAGQTVKEYRNKHKTFSDLYLNEGKIGATTTVNFYYRTKKGKVNYYRGFGAYTQFEKGMKLKAIISTDVDGLSPQTGYKFRTEGLNMAYNTVQSSKKGSLSGWLMRPSVVVTVKVKNKPHKHKKKTVKKHKPKKQKQSSKKARK